MRRLVLILGTVVLLLGTGCRPKPVDPAPPAQVQLAPVPPTLLVNLSDADLLKFNQASQANVESSEAAMQGRREGKIARWIYVLAAVCALVALAGGALFFFGSWGWLVPFKGFLGRASLVAGACVPVLFVAAVKIHALLRLLPIVLIGIALYAAWDLYWQWRNRDRER